MPTQELLIVDEHATNAIIELASSEKHQAYKDKITVKIEKRIGTKVGRIVKNMLELANGGYWSEKLDDGSVKNHFERPNLTANIYLLDRFMGKPVIRQEVKEEKKGIFIIETMIKKLASPAQTVEAVEVGKNDGSPSGITEAVGEFVNQAVSPDAL